MISEPIPNLYQDRFTRLTGNGELATDAIIKLMHRYLEGKPVKTGKRNLSAAERDLDFWMAGFWESASAEIFATEAFALALAQFCMIFYTLASLQQDSKLISVISHVPALKERISIQIQVSPTTGGRSEITGPGCVRCDVNATFKLLL